MHIVKVKQSEMYIFFFISKVKCIYIQVQLSVYTFKVRNVQLGNFLWSTKKHQYKHRIQVLHNTEMLIHQF